MEKQIGFMKALTSTIKAKKMTKDEIKTLQKERLDKLVRHARQWSPYYQKKYGQLGEVLAYEDLPSVNKRELMAHFDEWITDPDIKMAELQAFIHDTANIGHPFKGQYLVSTTSGSTGVPAIFLYDKNNLNVLDALAVTRSMAHKGIMSKLIKAGGKSAAVYATGGHYLGVASVRYKQYKNPLKAKQFAVFSVLWPIEEIVSKLNAFKPALLGGYPTALELLIPEKLAGRLTIQPVLINTGGEYLSKELAERLSQAFNCPVQSGYSCTEGGLMSFQCCEGHYHLNDDWIILEPVDADGVVVPPGTLSDKVFITNLANYVQPVIRYEVTDRVRVLKDPCPCGSPLTAIEIEGRTDDILAFENGSVCIPPLAIYVLLKEVAGVMRFQVVQISNDQIELRLETNGDRSKISKDAIQRLTAFFMEKGAHPEIQLSDQLPAPNSSGKFRHVMKG